MTDDELRNLAEAAIGDRAMPVQHTDAGFCAVARAREPELARAVLRLLEEREKVRDALAACMSIASMEPLGEAVAELVGTTLRFENEIEEWARYKAAVAAVVGVARLVVRNEPARLVELRDAVEDFDRRHGDA